MDQETTKVNGHCVVPLPLKTKDVNLPNNRGLALKSLNCLQRRFWKCENFMKCLRHLLQI